MWRLCILLYFLQVTQVTSFLPSQPKDKSATAAEKWRIKRQICQDGTYPHEGKTCCRCGAGQRLVKHCTGTPTDGQCVYCDADTYNSQPNSLETCQPCTSCSQENANLEEAERCTPAKDTVCRCKKGYYCPTRDCKICQPCNTCPSGTKVECTSTNNTVCKDGDERKDGAIAAGVIGLLILVVSGVVGFCFYKKRKQAVSTINSPRGRPGIHEEVNMWLLEPTIDVDGFQPLLPDIASELGWKEMKNIAIRCEVKKTVIENCRNNHPNDIAEQTLELLSEWNEQMGMDAPKRLIEILKETGEKQKMERLFKMFKDKNLIKENSSV